MLTIKIESIYDLISITVIVLNIYSIITFQFELIIINTLALISHKYIKNLTTGLYPMIFKRPDGATNCDLFNCGGDSSHKSGFPSGHMTSVSFYMNALMFKYNKELTLKTIFIYNIPCVLMGIARYSKKCHNIVQIVFGYLYGLMFAYLLNKYYYKMSANNEITENSENKPLLDKNKSGYETIIS